MPIKIKGVTILDNSLVTAVNRLTAIVGMDVDKLNVRVELEVTGSDPIPDEIPIEVMAQEPSLRRAHMSSMTGPFTTTAKRQGSTLTYTVSVAQSSLASFLKPGDGLNEVATVVRDGGTSSRLFRNKLSGGGWAVRGAAKQAAIGKPDLTGSLADEQPDARSLLLAGGVELLEVSVPASAGFKGGPLAKNWVFVRSPADIFFYSGHGAWWDCSLLREQAGHEYETWLEPETILASWKMQKDLASSPWDLDVMIINGCSVIGDWGMSDDGAKPPCARRWRKLLTSRDGPLFAILSYRDTAPLDGGGGDTIAKEMAEAIVGDLGTDWDAYARRWVEINAKYPATRTAAAIDNAGYWYINKKTAPGSHTHAARPMGGYDSSKPEGAIMGPGPVPSPP